MTHGLSEHVPSRGWGHRYVSLSFGIAVASIFNLLTMGIFQAFEHLPRISKIPSFGRFRRIIRYTQQAMPPVLDEADEDVLCCILSFLSLADIASCACVSRRLRRLCTDAAKVWLPMCHRRWGSSTDVKRWGRGLILYRGLYAVLTKWESLIGFWRGVVGSGGNGSLVVFEWGSHFIQGYRVVPASRGSLRVRKIPFLWVGASAGGNEICVLNPAHEIVVEDPAEVSLEGCSISSSSSSSSPCHVSSRFPTKHEGCCSSKGKDVFSEMDSEWDVGKLAALGLVLVNVHFVGKNHIVMEEICCQKQLGRKKMSLAEAAASASFGFSSRVDNGSSSGSSDTESYGRSPPGSFPYEMYQFLTNKVTSPGGDRAARKQRRKEKERAESQGRRLLEQEHFVKVVNCYPTKNRPLQGLWKGICHCMGLDFVLLSYNEHGGIICRRVGDCSNTARSGPVCWTAKSAVSLKTPLPADEQELYSARIHIRALDSIEFMGDEVVGMLGSARFNVDNSGKDFPGRIWLYDSGRFGFGLLHTKFIIDFRLICSKDCLLDVVD